MSSFFTGRCGLALRDAGGRVGHDDLNQGVDALLALKRLVTDLVGGEGVYAGGAAALSDLSGGGRSYPPVTVVLLDDAGQAWAYKTTAPAPISFNVAAAAADSGRLYAVPVLLAGVSPAAADGRLSQVTFVADVSSATPPAHSLLLGSGTIAASAFTTWTPANLTPATSLIRPATHHPTHQHGGADELATATATGNAIPKAGAGGTLAKEWLPDATTAAKGAVQLGSDGDTSAGHVVQGNDSRLLAVVHTSRTLTAGNGINPLGDLSADRTVSVKLASANPDLACDGNGLALAATLSGDHAVNGYLILANGKVRIVPDAKFGRPVSGTFAVGDRWIDAAGAMYLCTAAGSPGTLTQIQPGTALAWTGGGPTDVTATANWPSATRQDGYRIHEPGKFEWTYDGTQSRWLGPYKELTVNGISQTMSSSNYFTQAQIAIPTEDHDYLLNEWVFFYQAAAGTWGPSDRWDLSFNATPYASTSGVQWGATISVQAAGTTAQRGGPQTAIFASSSYGRLLVQGVKTGAAGNLSIVGFSAKYRPVRK